MAATTFFAEIVALQGSVFKGQVTSLSAPGMDGGFQILANHAPMLAAMGVGLISLKNAEGEKFNYTTSGGFVQVQENRVIVLAETVESVSEIDAERARKSEQAALDLIAKTEDPDEKAAAKQSLDRARNRLRASMSKV